MNNKKTIACTALSILAFTSVLSVSAATNLKGKILLQVEQNGEAWYVSPSTEERTYMGRPDDAFFVMREQGVGITNDNIAKIAVGEKNLNTNTDTDGDGLSDVIENAFGTDIDNADTDGDGNDDKTEILSGYDPTSSKGTYLIDDDFAESQAGKILLQVEQNGEAWYVNPDDNKRYFLSRPSDAFSIMRSLGLGISDENLEKISKRTTKEDGNSQNSKVVQNVGGINNFCEDLVAGDACEFVGKDDKTITGTCQLAKDDVLVCLNEDMQDPSTQRSMDDEVRSQPGNGSSNQQGPDFVAAAEILGVSEDELMEALGDPGKGAPNLATVAETLGVTEDEIAAAIGAPIK